MNMSMVRSNEVPAYALGMAWGETSRRNVRTDDLPNKPSASKFLSAQRLGAMVALVVGTGGIFSTNYVVARDSKGYPLQEFIYGSEHESEFFRQLLPRTPTESLSLIREVFKPSITELATVFGVSRQAIYNWQAGQAITQQNEARLSEVARAAELLAAHGVANQANVARRKLPGGKTFFEAVRSGEPAEVAAKRLIALANSEAVQRSALSERLAGRHRRAIALDDIGSPYLNEQG